MYSGACIALKQPVLCVLADHAISNKINYYHAAQYCLQLALPGTGLGGYILNTEVLLSESSDATTLASWRFFLRREERQRRMHGMATPTPIPKNMKKSSISKSGATII